MKNIQKKNVIILIILCCLGISFTFHADNKKKSLSKCYAHHPCQGYIYKETQDLVDLVNNAHDLILKKGKKAFKDFSKYQSIWRDHNQYIFVFDDKGNCLFNPAIPSLVGKNLINVYDIHNKPAIRDIVDIANKPGKNACGWVFYSWPDPTTLSFDWKSAFARKIVFENGQKWVVGSGMYGLKIEPSFIFNCVDDAAELIEKKGIKEAVATFRDSGSKFVFLGIYLFVIDPFGNPVFHPGFPNSADENLSAFKDFIGEHPIENLLKKLKTKKTAKVQFLYNDSNKKMPKKKLCYAHKAENNSTYIVGACYSLARPLWL